MYPCDRAATLQLDFSDWTFETCINTKIRVYFPDKKWNVSDKHFGQMLSHSLTFMFCLVLLQNKHSSLLYILGISLPIHQFTNLQKPVKPTSDIDQPLLVSSPKNWKKFHPANQPASNTPPQLYIIYAGISISETLVASATSSHHSDSD